jgi:hypothetical protein
MAIFRGVENANILIDDGPDAALAPFRGTWVALSTKSRFLGHGETAAQAYAAGQAAGEPKPTIRRVPA